MPALTAQELIYLRSTHPHKIIPYLSVLVPSTVYCGTVDGAHDKGAREITVVDVSGNIANIEEGMTVYVGTACGDYSISKRRFRSRAGQVLTLDENSVEWQAGDFITVMKTWELWPAFPRIDPTTYVFYKDYDVTYVDQNEEPPPVAIAGCHKAGFLESGTIIFTLDASDSYAIASGASISTYLWECDGGAIANANIAETTIQFNAAGTYTLKLTVTDDNGKSQVTRRVIFVHDRTGSDAPYLDFVVDTIHGSWESGGWDMSISILGDADFDDFPEGTLVVLWAETWYGSTEVSIGPAGNILFAGYIREESVRKELDTGNISFQADTIHKLLDNTKQFSVSLEYNSSPTTWYQYANLTVARAVHHLWRWHSTLFGIVDVLLPVGDTTLLYAVDDFEDGTLYSMVETFAREHGIFAHICCTKCGQVHLEIEANILEDADRAGLATTFTMIDSDRYAEDTDVEIVRDPIERVSYIMVSGTSYDGTTSAPICAHAPGDAPNPHGDVVTFDRLVLDDQADANYIAGKLLKIANNEIIEIRIPLAGNYFQAIDLVPQEFIVLNLAAGDTKRGVVLSDAKYIPRDVSANLFMADGTILPTLVLEPEIVDGVDGEFWQCVGDPAYVQPDPFNPVLPPLPDPPFPVFPGIPVPPIPVFVPDEELPDPIPTKSPNVAFVMTKSQLGRTKNFNDGSPNWEDIKPAAATGVLVRFTINQDDNTGLLVEDSGDFGKVFYCEDVLAEVPAWDQILNDAEIYSQLTTQLSDPGIITFSAVGVGTKLWTGVVVPPSAGLGGSGTELIYVRISRSATHYLGNALPSAGYHIMFVSANQGAGWFVYFFPYSATQLLTMELHADRARAWAIDGGSGYIIGGGFNTGSRREHRGATKAAGATASGITPPAYGVGGDGGTAVIRMTPTTLAGGYFGLHDNEDLKYSPEPGNIETWWDYEYEDSQVQDLSYGAALSRAADDSIYYVATGLSLPDGSAEATYVNHVIQQSSVDLYGIDDSIGHITPVMEDYGRYAIVRLKAQAVGVTTDLIHWIDYGTIYDKSGDWVAVMGAWGGAGGFGGSSQTVGNCMIVFFDEEQ